MLEQSLSDVYTKFKLHFYRKVFSRFESREASLTTVETYCIEIIHALEHPTVNEFASFAQISPPNAAYKVTNLIQKGYLKKIRSKTDKREYFLEVTPKYFEYYNLNHGYILTVIDRIKDRFTPQEVTLLDHILTVMYDELMPEVPLPHRNQDLP
ncbi:transcriptional regulator, MarR family [Clostridium sp. MSTE9]|uniref:MarR family transcriptional regulator n=1 Tax=Clostridium sp. (strain MSTE9) TaxID=1105031 RepID=UPI00026F29F7|nr:MarR family transcriptional regulator [Clostridium sp. MSTE9]EJF40134.1 transcriptional regulator, MarR family [Clostridium sp. MSTE9]